MEKEKTFSTKDKSAKGGSDKGFQKKIKEPKCGEKATANSCKNSESVVDNREKTTANEFESNESGLESGVSFWDFSKEKQTAVLFLHGYLSKKESFFYSANYFKKFYRILAPDMQGFGQAEELKEPWGVDEYAASIEQFLSNFDYKYLYIVAHSFGARVAMKLSERGKIRIDKLVLTGAAGLKPRRGIRYYYKIYSYKLKRKLGLDVTDCGSKEYKTLNSVMKQSYKKIVNENLAEAAKTITAPTLLVFGRNDTSTPLYMARKLHKIIKNSSLYIVENSGHFCFSDKPLEFNALVYAFFKDGKI